MPSPPFSDVLVGPRSNVTVVLDHNLCSKRPSSSVSFRIEPIDQSVLLDGREFIVDSSAGHIRLEVYAFPGCKQAELMVKR